MTILSGAMTIGAMIAFSFGCSTSNLSPADAGTTGADAGACFIAFQTDFSKFQTWPRTFLGDGPIEGHFVGPRYAYVKEKPPAGATAFPVGSIIVKTVEQGPKPQDWILFGMTKRGCNYNSKGAIGWEFFTLGINSEGVPVIASRGFNPPEPEIEGGVGHGYGESDGGITCNRCHGVAAATDYILSPTLAPGAP